MSITELEVIAASRRRAKANDPWLTVPEIADQLGVSRMTIYRAVNGDYLRSVRIGRSFRVRTTWFEAWIEDGARTSEADL
jgi:excisionase family DNA binding protein